MSVNVELLRRTLAHIEAHPEEWSQKDWQCGTAACFAGHAAHLAGARWVNPESESIWEGAGELFTPDGGRGFVWDYAPEVLGLDSYGHPLFMASNTLDDLRRIVADLCAGSA